MAGAQRSTFKNNPDIASEARLLLHAEFYFPQILTCRRTLSIGTAQPVVEFLIILDGLRRYGVGKPVARGVPVILAIGQNLEAMNLAVKALRG